MIWLIDRSEIENSVYCDGSSSNSLFELNVRNFINGNSVVCTTSKNVFYDDICSILYSRRPFTPTLQTY